MVFLKLKKTISKLNKKKHFVATALIVDLSENAKVLLIKHKKSGKWLPPGGHLDENELPDDCVLREVKEETALSVEIISEALDVSGEDVETLHTPLLVQLEDIDEEHQHVDLQYLCKAKEGKVHEGKHEEHDGISWFSEAELKEFPELPFDVRENSFKAIVKARELKEKGLF